MTADEIYAQLERALAELSDDQTPPDVAAEAVRTYALAAIALRLREPPNYVVLGNGTVVSWGRPVVHESTEPAVPSSIPPDDFEPDEKRPPPSPWAGLETHGKGGPIGG